ncbi:MAG: hypothetical protein M3486_08800 [Actinomycetota bacterium]|nr:hypothetical protein [Actinomycetota bacterium]
MDDAADTALALEESAAVEVALPTFAVLARLRSTAADSAAAIADVIAQVAPAAGLYDDVVIERQEDDGSFWVVVRFVTVSVDAHTAVLGVHETLTGEGVAVDEVWALPI